MPSLGPLEIVVIAVVALLVFGPNRLPEMGRQVGRAVRELRKFQDSVRDELHGVMNSMDSSPTASDSGTPPTPPPVVPPGSTSTAAPAPARQIAPTRPGGAQAPSRFRPSVTPTAAGAASAATAGTAPPAPVPPAPAPPTGASGSHAPSRFRAPKH